MTLKEMRAMFQPGQKWHALRLNDHWPGIGKHNDEVRTIRQVRGKDIVFLTPDGEPSMPPGRLSLEMSRAARARNFSQWSPSDEDW